MNIILCFLFSSLLMLHKNKFSDTCNCYNDTKYDKEYCNNELKSFNKECSGSGLELLDISDYVENNSCKCYSKHYKHWWIKHCMLSVCCLKEYCYTDQYKCCKHLESCIDEGLFGPDAYLDMHRKCLVVSQRPPESTPAPAPKPEKQPEKQTDMPERDQYQKILDELRRVNDAIPDEEMTDKISRLEAVSAKIFEQARTDPDKLPQMRKFMDYYLPTSLKLLNTYAELDRQGIEGDNITESKRRIELTMDTLVKAFENQLDRLFASDALDVSTDIDVMQNMLRADGLTDDTPFKL